MKNVKTMTDVELLMEKSHMEQLGFSGEVQLLEINEELAKRWANRKKQEEKLYTQRQKLKNDRIRKMGSKLAESLKIGDTIIVSNTGRGRNQVVEVEKVVSISETDKFMVINGRRMKKGTHRGIFLGYGKLI